MHSDNGSGSTDMRHKFRSHMCADQVDVMKAKQVLCRTLYVAGEDQQSQGVGGMKHDSLPSSLYVPVPHKRGLDGLYL